MRIYPGVVHWNQICKFNCNSFVSAAGWFISQDCSCALLWLYPILNPESCQEAYLNVGSQSLVWMTSAQCWNAGGPWHWYWQVYAQEYTLRLSMVDFPTERVQYRRRVSSGQAWQMPAILGAECSIEVRGLLLLTDGIPYCNWANPLLHSIERHLCLCMLQSNFYCIIPWM